MEPRLQQDDHELWDNVWAPAFRAHAKTAGFQRRLARAREIAINGCKQAQSPCVYVSGGKDSTALGELIFGELGIKASCASQKDDLDYPGEEVFIEEIGQRWGVDIEILRLPIKLLDIIPGLNLQLGEDIHSRNTDFSAAFYNVVEEHNTKHDAIALGLRKEESKARLLDRITHGPLYRRTKDGLLRICPLHDWTGQDVLAYILHRGCPLFPIYKCIAFCHEDAPWHIRKSWWWPGKSARWGGVAWLRHYYPSLYRKLLEIMPSASMAV